MKKMPIEATVVDAYKFVFSNIISIIGTVWLPVVIFAAVAAAFLWGIVPHDWFCGRFEPPKDPQAFVAGRIGLILLALPCLSITGLVVGAMIKVGLLRLALGEVQGTTLIWFSLGARVWRMIGADFVAVFLMILLEIASVLLFLLLNGLMAVIPHLPALLVGLINAVLAIAVIIGVLYTMVRLFFFLPAVVVAENKIGLRRSWALGEGNVWRAIIVWLAVCIPVQMIATIAIYATVIPTVIVQAIHMQPNDPQAALAFLISLWPLLPAIILIGLAAGLIMAATILGAIGKGYKAVIADAA